MRRLGVGLLLVAALGCAQDDVIADLVASQDAGTDAGTNPVPTCSRRIALPPDLDEVVRAQALCGCTGLAASAALEVTGGLASDGSLDASGRLAAGALSVAGSVRGGSAEAHVSGDLRVGGSWASSGLLRVGGDAMIGGRLSAAELEVTGTLRQPPAAEREIAGGERLGAVEVGPVEVAPPCACARFAAALPRAVDLAGAPEARKVEIAPAGDLDLECGLSVLEGPAAGPDAALTVRVRGAATLVVPGRLAVAALTVVGLDAYASLDLMIGGPLLLPDALSVQGASMRVFVEGPGSSRLPPRTSADVELLAPDAELLVETGLEWPGRLLVGRLAAAGPVRVGP